MIFPDVTDNSFVVIFPFIMRSSFNVTVSFIVTLPLTINPFEGLVVVK